VATRESGIPDFRTLHRTVSKRQEAGLVLWAFDLLFARGRDIRELPYMERKLRLAKLVARAKLRSLRHSEPFAGGERLLAECGKRGLEGIVSKRRDSAYRSGKQPSWVKIKCQAWREANRDRHKLFEQRRSGTNRV
jgi:bifunctional non-homologous end joining protein LigD